MLTDNKLALNAGWDLEMLSLEIGELGEAGFDLNLTGFDEFELGELFAERTQGRTDPDDADTLRGSPPWQSWDPIKPPHLKPNSEDAGTCNCRQHDNKR